MVELENDGGENELSFTDILQCFPNEQTTEVDLTEERPRIEERPSRKRQTASTAQKNI